MQFNTTVWQKTGTECKSKNKPGFGYGQSALNSVSAETLPRNAETAVTVKLARTVTLAVWQLGYCMAVEDKSVLVLAGIDDSKLDSTTSHPSSSSHSLPRRVVCYPGHPAPMIMGGLVLRLQCACFVYSYSRYPLVGSRFRSRYGYGRK